MVRLDAVAPTVSTPSFCHWYVKLSPTAVTSRVKSSPGHRAVFANPGCTVIAVSTPTFTGATALVTVPQAPVTSTL